MPFARYAALLILVGCTCSATPEPVKPPDVSAKKTAQGKGKKKGAPAKQPVLRQAIFEVPVATIDGDNVNELRTRVLMAAEAADPSAEKVTGEVLNAWNCRRMVAYPVEGVEGTTVTVWERFESPACEGTIEKSWVELIRRSDARATERGTYGEYPFKMAVQLATYDPTFEPPTEPSDDPDAPDGWTHVFDAVHDAERGSSDAKGAFPHDAAWLAERLPEGATLGTPVVAESVRWSLAQVVIASEKMQVEAEVIRCGPEGELHDLGARIVFRTNRRLAGHSPSNPKDVVVIPKVESFGDALVTSLGDVVSGPNLTPAAIAACSP